MNIQSQNCGVYNNSKSFTGLTSKLSKSVYSKEQINDLINKYPKSDGIVGSLPRAWIVNIPKAERKQNIKNIYSGLREIIDNMASSTFSNISKAMGVLLKNNKAIKSTDGMEFMELGNGSFGVGYFVKADNKNYVLKKFFNTGYNQFYANHGNLVEQNYIKFINKNSSKVSPNWNKTHFGDLKSGYMFSDYVGHMDKAPKRKTDLKTLGMIYTDGHPANMISGKYIDAGGLVASPLSNIKSARYIFKKYNKIQNNADKLKFINKVLSDKSKPQYNDRVVGAMYAAADLGNSYDTKNLISKILAKSNPKANSIFLNNENFSKYHSVKNLSTIIKTGDLENIKNIPYHVSKLANKDKTKIYRQLFKLHDEETNYSMAFNLENSNRTFTLQHLNTFLKLDSRKVDEVLANRISNLPFEKFVEVSKKLAKRANSNTKDVISQNLVWGVPSSCKITFLDEMLKLKDNELNRKLFEHTIGSHVFYEADKLKVKQKFLEFAKNDPELMKMINQNFW